MKVSYRSEDPKLIMTGILAYFHLYLKMFVSDLCVFMTMGLCHCCPITNLIIIAGDFHTTKSSAQCIALQHAPSAFASQKDPWVAAAFHTMSIGITLRSVFHLSVKGKIKATQKVMKQNPNLHAGVYCVIVRYIFVAVHLITSHDKLAACPPCV